MHKTVRIIFFKNNFLKIFKIRYKMKIKLIGNKQNKLIKINIK